MRELVLRRLVIQGFKSFREKTTINFPHTAGLRYLTGDNKVEPELGANGAGKSALWDAFVWCHYNLTSKRRKASDVLSWGEKRIEVSAEWEDPSDGTTCTIFRQSHPNKLFIDGEPAEQADVDAILGANFDCCLQSVVFGQGVQTFFDKDNAGRGELLDEVLDIKLWLDAAETATADAKVITQRIVTNERKLANVLGQLEGLEPETTFERLIAEWEEDLRTRFEETVTQVESLEQTISETRNAFQAAETAYVSACASVDDELRELDKLSKKTNDSIHQLQRGIGGIDAESNKATRELASYTKEGKCPTCGQYVAPTMRKDHFAKLNKQVDGLRVQRQAVLDQIAVLEKDLTKTSLEWTRVNRVKLDAEGPVNTLKFKLQAEERQLSALEKQAESLMEDVPNPHAAALEANRCKRAMLEEDRATVQSVVFADQARLEKAEYWKAAFKRVRLWLMKRVLAVLEIEVSGAAAALGLPGWSIKFATETETKGGNMKPGIHILVSSPHTPGVWSDQSGGEEQRVRLAVAIGFAAVVQRMAGVWNRLEVWDEPSNWLSDKGIEDLIECLAYRAQTAGKCIWVVDHRTMVSGSFLETWSVIKDTCGSRIKVIATEG